LEYEIAAIMGRMSGTLGGFLERVDIRIACKTDMICKMRNGKTTKKKL